MSELQRKARSIDQVIEMVDAALRLRSSSDDAVTSIRRSWLQTVREHLATRGFALTEEDKRDLCLMPVVFQELNYDGFSWSKRENPLGALEDIVEIDVVVWSGGFCRSEISDSEYRRYWRHCLNTIDYRQESARRQAQTLPTKESP